jgi:REP element-mobilizing transposase RayT
MPRRGNVFAKECYYHIYNRGVERGQLFFGSDNYEYCLRLVKRYIIRYGVTVIAYCLMPNHYHFLLYQKTEQALSKFIGVLFNTYVQAVNRQQGRSGTLFEGRFRHVQVDRDEYVMHLCRYIHLNPVKAGLVPGPGDWLYSNYLDWIGHRPGTLKDEAFIRKYWETPAQYQAFVSNYQEQDRQKIAKYLWD